ncbi:long-chain fatty acid--CoA ligase [Paenibacillus sp. PL2-23]|uniref:long-chain fatty acid--CoA ligase n=1 Tax=Paenibacillus sp. PL2-23 TaxID=2100729 RepID=UPI0030F6E48C
MSVDELLKRFSADYAQRPAMVWRENVYTYEWLVKRALSCGDKLAGERHVVSLEADYSPEAVAALFGLLRAGCVVVPLAPELPARKRDEYMDIAQVSLRSRWTGDQIHFAMEERGRRAEHPLLASLLEEGSGGLVLFSSGTTGKSKAAVHSSERLLRKFRTAGRSSRTIPFMLFDHIGGLNILLQTLASGGCLYVAEDRSPHEVCRLIERHRIEVLPTSPTFMRLLLISGVCQHYDLSSLQVVSYGSEVMPPHTLALWNKQFPGVRAVQAYGMSEIGVLRTRSASSESLSFSIADSELQYRIVDGLLELKSGTAMLGYLNAPSPFTRDGWLRTGDEAIVEGNDIRILGRRSELINVGGEKVYPAEIESVIEQMDSISEVAVTAEPSAITGQLIKATVRLRQEIGLKELRGMIRAYCLEHLPPYKIPQKIEVTTEPLISNRMKKVRRPHSI